MKKNTTIELNVTPLPPYTTKDVEELVPELVTSLINEYSVKEEIEFVSVDFPQRHMPGSTPVDINLVLEVAVAYAPVVVLFSTALAEILHKRFGKVKIKGIKGDDELEIENDDNDKKITIELGKYEIEILYKERAYVSKIEKKH